MSLTGLGLYTIPEAARLSGVRAGTLRRWVQGYTHSSEKHKNHPPIWPSEIASEELDAVSFRDLLEARFVRAFRESGISLQHIRIAAEYAREVLDNPYPFTCQRFRTDGQTIFAEALKTTGEIDLLDLRKRQHVLTSVIEPSLYKGIEFDTREQALRWFPLRKNRAIVLDPQFAFGKPTLTGTSIRTDILYDAWLAEDKNKRQVARLYDVPVADVKAAIDFEQHQFA